MQNSKCDVIEVDFMTSHNCTMLQFLVDFKWAHVEKESLLLFSEKFTFSSDDGVGAKNEKFELQLRSESNNWNLNVDCM